MTQRATEEETEMLQATLDAATRRLVWLAAIEDAQNAWVPAAETAKRLSDRRIRVIRDALNAPPDERPSHREVRELTGITTNKRLQDIKNNRTTVASRRRRNV